MKIQFTAGAVLAFSALSVSNAGMAAEQTEPVIVTATRTAQIADASVAPVIVIDQQTLQQNPGADVADLLRMYTGIEISRNGGPSQTTSMFIRGTNSTQTLVMIDGVKMNSGTADIAALQNIDISTIDHIEIVLGPRSTLYGSEAIGGVINIITKQRKTDGSDFSAAAGGGSYGTKQIRLSAHHHVDDRGAGIEASYIKSDGFPTLSSSNINRGYDNLNLHLYGSKHIGDTDYKISHWQSSGNTQYLDYYTGTPLDQDFLNTTTTISAKTPMSTSWVSKLNLSHVSDKIDQNQTENLTDPLYGLPFKDFAHTSRYSLDWQNDIQWNMQNLLTAGLYRDQEETTALSYGIAFDTSSYTNAAYAQNVRTTKNTSLITGLRYTNNQIYGDHSTWNLEYGLNLTDSLRLTLANNSGFRAPDSNELYAIGGNPNLKPEKSVNNEVGLRYKLSNAQGIRLSAFRNRITNLIVYDSSFVAQNIGQATITGSELAYNFVGQHWSASASASVQDPHDDINNSQLLRRSKHTYTAKIGYHGHNFNFGIEAFHSGNRPDYGAILDPYTLVNLSGEYRFTQSLSMSLRIENLGDADYQVASGYNTPGRSAYAELRYTM